MTPTSLRASSHRKPLRLWPGLTLAALLLVLWKGVPLISPTVQAGYISAAGSAGCGLLVGLWWLLGSRAAWLERFLALGLAIGGLILTSKLNHESIAEAGQGMLFLIQSIPMLALAFVAWAFLTRHLGDGPRRVTMVLTILVATFGWALLRSDGIESSGSQLAWRWSPTPEEKLLARGTEPRAAARAAIDQATLPEWPGFRGTLRDGVVRGARIGTNWNEQPPRELWRRPVGPGWSSFAVHGEHFYTQEQRGEEEVVSCYALADGELVWLHRDTARFWEANAGAGPRGTPTLHDGRVYSFGATGLLNALDAATGERIWSRDVASDTGIEMPYWGFSSSPLIVGELVLITAVGKLAAYDLATGTPRWFGPEGGNGYSSPHLATIDGVQQVLQLSGTGAVSVSPTDGTVLWEHAWEGYPIAQPSRTANGDLLINAGQSGGIRRLRVSLQDGRWALEERWTSTRLKPYFNDFVVHQGHAYGFDGRILAAIDLATGERVWKGGRYGQGQLVLLPDQDLLLVSSEKGEVALVAAKPDGFEELARVAAVTGKSWNHPVVVDDLLLVRNSEEMAAFRLPRGEG